MMSPGRLTAMISSTAADLPEHRKQVADACLRVGVFPVGMEQLPARDANGIKVSLEMVDKADIYIGIYAWRYGWVPEFDNPGMISITEMELNRAIERKIPILVFVIHKDHSLTIEMVETDKNAQDKLAKLKERASKGRGRREFKSPIDLRGEIIHALADFKERQRGSSGEKAALSIHPPTFIPKPPEPYIAHPYSLLQTQNVVGRQDELNLLTDWVTANRVVSAGSCIFSLVAIGGMGKSALTWKWFKDIAPNELPQMAGHLWWSFYESDAHWDNFVIRALAYVSGQSEKTVCELKAPDREDQLWLILDQQPFLLVLDGLERILLAYARIDAAQMLDDDLDDKTANRVAHAMGLPPGAADSFVGRHQLRLTADHRAGNFLRRLSQIRMSRILITTRLYPAELQSETGAPLPGCFAQFLNGLTDSDALNLWREFHVTGSSEQLLPLFRSFNNYPLLIRALAGEVAAFRGGPGDFDKWRAKNPKFDPSQLSLKNAKTHVLEYALRGLKPKLRKVLHTIAAFRMPATWDTLRELLVGSGHIKKVVTNKSSKPCPNDHALDLALTELEDRGLVGWDKQSNRYDLHPIVRGVVWSGLTHRSRHDIHGELLSYFEAVPMTDWRVVEKYDQLSPAIEVYNALLGMKRFEEASRMFFDQLDGVTHNRLSASRQRIELLRPLVEIDEDNGLPALQEPTMLVAVFNALGRACIYSGDLKMATHYLGCGLSLTEQSPLLSAPDAFCLCDISNAFRPAGCLLNAEATALEAIAAWRNSKRPLQETRSGVRLGLAFAARGMGRESSVVLHRALSSAKLHRHQQPEGYVLAALAQKDLWFGCFQSALGNAIRAGLVADRSRFERDIARAARTHGEASLWMGDHETALERLSFAMAHARAVNFVEEEISALTALAERHRQRKELQPAYELLNQVWDAAEHGPYLLLHTDALNVLAHIERDQGNDGAAIVAATKAYELAWCDGISTDGKVCYAYHHGLTIARKHLRELGAPEPHLAPFVESEFDPLPNVELNPKDEFWVDPKILDSNL